MKYGTIAMHHSMSREESLKRVITFMLEGVTDTTVMEKYVRERFDICFAEGDVLSTDFVNRNGDTIRVFHNQTMMQALGHL